MTAELPDLSALAAQHVGGELLPAEMLDTITTAIANNPRSLQTSIGPSEIGHPCNRRLGLHFLDAPKTNDNPAGHWKPTVGTAVHTWLQDTFTQANAGHKHARWLTELRVNIGDYNGKPVTGNLDLYDIVTGTVVDFKIVGVTSLRAKRAAGHPGEQYATQLHGYGRGLTRRGLPVTNVAILALPQNGELREAWYWQEPYNEQHVIDALSRATAIDQLVTRYGWKVLDMLPTADAHCSFCDWFKPGSTDLREGCPGHPGSTAANNSRPPATLADALK